MLLHPALVLIGALLLVALAVLLFPHPGHTRRVLGIRMGEAEAGTLQTPDDLLAFAARVQGPEETEGRAAVLVLSDLPMGPLLPPLALRPRRGARGRPPHVACA